MAQVDPQSTNARSEEDDVDRDMKEYCHQQRDSRDFLKKEALESGRYPDLPKNSAEE